LPVCWRFLAPVPARRRRRRLRWCRLRHRRRLPSSRIRCRRRPRTITRIARATTATTCTTSTTSTITTCITSFTRRRPRAVPLRLQGPARRQRRWLLRRPS